MGGATGVGAGEGMSGIGDGEGKPGIKNEEEPSSRFEPSPKLS